VFLHQHNALYFITTKTSKISVICDDTMGADVWDELSTGFSKTSTLAYQTTRRYISHDSNLNNPCRENLRSRKFRDIYCLYIISVICVCYI
jgi:hypothetical protein